MLRSKTSSWIRVACRRCSRDRPLGRIEEGDEQRIFALCQADQLAPRIGQAPAAPVEQPAAEPAAALLGVARRRGVSDLAPPQHRPDPRQELPQSERLGDVVVGAEFQSDNAVDLVAAVTGRDYDRNIRMRADFTEQIKAILLT